MARGFSQRDRLEHLRAEADAAAKERAEKAAAREAAKTEKPATPRRSSSRSSAAKPAPAGRVRVVWIVCDRGGREVETFPYKEQDQARQRAEQLAEETGHPHFVSKGEVPFDS